MNAKRETRPTFVPKDGEDLRVGAEVDAHALGAALLIGGAEDGELGVPRLPGLFLVVRV